jgi:hypothetical protein
LQDPGGAQHLVLKSSAGEACCEGDGGDEEHQRGGVGVGGAEGGLPGRQVVSIDVLVFVEVGRQERAVDHVDDELAGDGVGERVAGGELVGRRDAESQVAGFDRGVERDELRLIAEGEIDFGGEREIALDWVMRIISSCQSVALVVS